MCRARRHRDDRGASIVELALIAPALVVVVLGVIDIGRAYRMQIRLENAAREGASYAVIEPNRFDCASGDDVYDRVVSEEPTIEALDGFVVEVWTDTDGTDDMAEQLTGCGGTEGDRGDRIRVDVRARFDVLTPMIEQIVGSTIEITGSAMVEAQ